MTSQGFGETLFNRDRSITPQAVGDAQPIPVALLLLFPHLFLFLNMLSFNPNVREGNKTRQDTHLSFGCVLQQQDGFGAPLKGIHAGVVGSEAADSEL